MKTLFIEARKKGIGIEKNILKFISSLPKEISILYSIQYKDLAEQYKKEAEKRGKKILLFSQVLGCSYPKLKSSTILIGSGRFHAVNIASRTQMPIYIIDSNKISEITKEEIEKMQNKKKAALIKLYSSKEIGIIVSTKSGQNKTAEALKLKREIESKGKKVYLFLADNINIAELENFPLPIYINTACPGLSFDSPKILNIDDIKEY